MAAEVVTVDFASLAAADDSEPLQAIILDVGHGNCTILRDGHQICVVDMPRGREIIDAIISNGCSYVKHLVLSHPDEDHIGGAAKLLAEDEISIENFWCNASAIQDTDTYLDLLEQAALRDATNQTRYRNNLNVGARSDLDFGRVQIEVLHPGVMYAGVGQTKPGHKLGKITGNGMSVVLRVKLAGEPAVLLAADIDADGFQTILERDPDLTCKVLVFPHHGGLAGGGDSLAFARSICQRTSPEIVVFSMGRSRFSNPLPEIIAGVKEGAPSAHIACTQLSRRCHADSLELPEASVNSSGWPSRGSSRSFCCAGTLTLQRSDHGISVQPSLERHSAFVKTVHSPQCRSADPADDNAEPS